MIHTLLKTDAGYDIMADNGHDPEVNLFGVKSLEDAIQFVSILNGGGMLSASALKKLTKTIRKPPKESTRTQVS